MCLTSKIAIITHMLDFVGGCEALEVSLVEKAPPDRKVV